MSNSNSKESTPLSFRYERKYKVNQMGTRLAQQVIRNHPSSFRELFPDRQVNNIYFDTIDLNTYKDNVAGIAERKKFRVRWYGDEKIQRIEDPILEVKIKDNQLGAKKFYELEAFEYSNIAALTKQVNKALNTHSPLFPVLMNSYDRSYYSTWDSQFRVTIDRRMRYYSMLNARKFDRYNLADDEVVIELKYPDHLDEKADRIMQYLPFRQTKSSKYVTGVNMTVGEF